MAEAERMADQGREVITSVNASAADITAVEELCTLPGKYAPPAGRLLLACIDGEPAATAAFRPLRQDACEAKRLYVRPAYRRRGVAGSLLAALVQEARRAG